MEGHLAVLGQELAEPCDPLGLAVAGLVAEHGDGHLGIGGERASGERGAAVVGGVVVVGALAVALVVVDVCWAGVGSSTVGRPVVRGDDPNDQTDIDDDGEDTEPDVGPPEAMHSDIVPHRVLSSRTVARSQPDETVAPTRWL